MIPMDLVQRQLLSNKPLVVIMFIIYTNILHQGAYKDLAGLFRYIIAQLVMVRRFKYRQKDRDDIGMFVILMVKAVI